MRPRSMPPFHGGTWMRSRYSGKAALGGDGIRFARERPRVGWTILREWGRYAAVAFSGGIDSTFVLAEGGAEFSDGSL